MPSESAITERDQSLVQAQLAAAMRDALKRTLVEPLPFEVLFLLDLLAAKEQAARRPSGPSPASH